VGIWDFPRAYIYMWNHFREEFHTRFPDATFEVEHEKYSPWQTEKMKCWSKCLVEKYQDVDEEIVLVGYSMGGVVATALAPKLKNVRAVVTLFAPHTTLDSRFSRALSSNLDGLGTIPVLSFSGKYDIVVPNGAEYPKAARHVELASDHLFWLLVSKNPAAVIAGETVNLLAVS
jgi:predicted esterase